MSENLDRAQLAKNVRLQCLAGRESFAQATTHILACEEASLSVCPLLRSALIT